MCPPNPILIIKAPTLPSFNGRKNHPHPRAANPKPHAESSEDRYVGFKVWGLGFRPYSAMQHCCIDTRKRQIETDHCKPNPEPKDKKLMEAGSDDGLHEENGLGQDRP